MLALYLRVVPRVIRREIIAVLTLVPLRAVTVEGPERVDTLSSVSALALVALIYILVTSARAQTKNTLLCMGVVKLICIKAKRRRMRDESVTVSLKDGKENEHFGDHLFRGPFSSFLNRQIIFTDPPVIPINMALM